MKLGIISFQNQKNKSLYINIWLPESLFVYSWGKIKVMNTVEKISQICDEMLAFSRTAGTVVNDEIDYDTLAEEQAQQDAYESGRVFF